MRNSSNSSSRKNLGVRPYHRPYKVLLSACAANCTTGTILAIAWWRGEGEGNAQVRLRVYLGYPIMRQETLEDDWSVHTRVSSFSLAYRGHTARHCHKGFTWGSECEICNPRFEREIKLVRLKLNSNCQYFAVSIQLAKQRHRQS